MYLRHSVRFLVLLTLAIGMCCSALAQTTPGKDPNTELLKAVEAMQQQIHDLQAAVTDLRAQSETYRRETETLRQELQGTRGSSAYAKQQPVTTTDGQGYTASAPAEMQEVEPQTVPLDEQLRLLTGKVNEQYQTKVESGSKYRVKLSGLILLNLFNNRGSVDSIDVPGIAEPLNPLFGHGAFGGSLRQSQIGVEVFGPEWRGAKITGDLRFDFAGGFPESNNGVTLGIMRLRTGTIRFDWPTTSVVAGQDAPFFSPLSPTSLAQIAEPAFSYAGNLWTWTPQLRVEHHVNLTANQSMQVQAGILDPLTGQPPRAQAERLPQAGEISRQPGYAARLAWSRGHGDSVATLGGGGYYSRQDWGFGRHVDGWAATADWEIPITNRFGLSGEFYRGRAIGGLGAAKYYSVLSTNVLYNSGAQVRGLDVMGGWAQFKFRATPTLQFNAAFGQDSPYSSELRAFSAVYNLLNPQLGRNQSMMFNFIYRPRSNLVFSTEYRHIDSVRLNQDRLSAEHVNMSVGVLF